MNDTIPHNGAEEAKHGARTRDYRKSASDHVAYALLVYTGLQIFVTVHAMKSATTGTLSILPYIALVVLVAGIIPSCRKFERCWISRSDEEAHDPALADEFRRDMLWLWSLAIGLPFLLTGLIKGIVALV